MKAESSIILSYVRARWAWLIVLVYCAAGLLLRAYGGINILPHCLWTAIFHHHCPGCGITTACVHLMHGQWAAAWHTNPLAIPACLIILAACLRDFIKFYRNFAVSNE